MKYLSTKTFFLVTIFCLFSVRAFAQDITYLDENYNPASAENYTYKRVIKYKEPIINPNFGIGYRGNITTNPTPTGLHVCTLIDYYRNGEPALVVNVLSLQPTCTSWAFDGQAIFYYKGGGIKKKAPYHSGKLHGWAIAYNEDGTEQTREIYQNGKLIEENKFPVPENSPLVGTWKYVKYGKSYYGSQPPVLATSTITYHPDSILEQTTKNSISSGITYTNWKYIPQGNFSGIEELYQGDEMILRGTIRWIDRNQIEYTCTFSQNATIIGQSYLWTRQ